MDKWKTTDDKLDFIEELEQLELMSKEDWEDISILLQDKDSEVRLRASELLALFPTRESERLLLSIRKDPDYLVRASACDSLYFSKSLETLNFLIDSAKDKRYLVRGYAILSIGDVQYHIDSDKSTTVSFLENLYHKEPSEWVRIAISRSLFILGKSSYGDYLLSMINSRYYKNRCFVISLLEQLIESKSDFVIPKMRTVLESRLERENAQSVKLKLIRLFEVLDSKVV